MSLLVVAVLSALACGIGINSVAGLCATETQCLADIKALQDQLTAAKAKAASAALLISTTEESIRQKIEECSFSCPDGFERFPGAKKCFKTVSGLSNFDEAQAKCVALNEKSHLAFIESQEEQDFAVQYIKSVTQPDATTTPGYWLGAQRADKTCNTDIVWVKPSGEQTALTYTGWYTGEPNCSGGIEFCVEMRENLSYDWNDISCGATNEPKWPLCQYP